MIQPSSSGIDTKGSLVVVAGCTGTGKSDLGVEIAKKFNGEVINADSMQLYQGLDIVTNKITDEEAQGIPHHLIGFLSPVDEYNVHRFKTDALKCIEEIWERGKLPVLVGGTAYYIEGVLYEDSLVEVGTPEEVEKLRQENKHKTEKELYEYLESIDAGAAAQVHPNNRARVQRALEICLLSNGNKKDKVQDQKKLRFDKTALFILDAETNVLDERLDKRVDKMQNKGLMKELTEFYEKYKSSLGSHGIKQSIGIKEFIPVLDLRKEEYTTRKYEKLLKHCTSQLQLNTRKYARKQRNWFNMRFVRRKNLREVPNSVVLNTSRNFYEKVVPFALEQLEGFYKKGEFDNNAIEESEVTIELEKEAIKDEDYAKKANEVNYCEVCHKHIHGRDCWERHIAGRKHLYNVRRFGDGNVNEKVEEPKDSGESFELPEKRQKVEEKET